MAAISGANLATSKALAQMPTDSPTHRTVTVRSPWLNYPWKRCGTQRRGAAGRMSIRPAYAVPDSLSEKVAESIKNAEETCSDDPASGECAAAWDEVEELSAAASHARDKKKDSDPLEAYCKENPETEECRTYED